MMSPEETISSHADHHKLDYVDEILNPECVVAIRLRTWLNCWHFAIGIWLMVAGS